MVGKQLFSIFWSIEPKLNCDANFFKWLLIITWEKIAAFCSIYLILLLLKKDLHFCI